MDIDKHIPDAGMLAVGKRGHLSTELVQQLQKIKTDAMQAAVHEGIKSGLTDQANILTIAGFLMPLKGSKDNPWNAYIVLNIGSIPAGGMSFTPHICSDCFLSLLLDSDEQGVHGNPRGQVA